MSLDQVGFTINIHVYSLTQSVISGRTYLGNDERISFPSAVTVPISACVDGTNIDLMQSFMRTNFALLQHQFTPLQRIQRWLGRNDQPLFDSIFVYQNASNETVDGNSTWEIFNELSVVEVCRNS